MSYQGIDTYHGTFNLRDRWTPAVQVDMFIRRAADTYAADPVNLEAVFQILDEARAKAEEAESKELQCKVQMAHGDLYYRHREWKSALFYYDKALVGWPVYGPQVREKRDYCYRMLNGG